LALSYSVPWSDEDFAQGSINDGPLVMRELVPGAFSRVYGDKSGYLYTLDGTGFQEDNRLMPTERINRRAVSPVQTKKVENVLNAMRDAGMVLRKFEDPFDPDLDPIDAPESKLAARIKAFGSEIPGLPKLPSIAPIAPAPGTAAKSTMGMAPTFPEMDLNDRKQKEMDAWMSWDKNGRNETDLAPIVKSLKPLVQHQFNSYRGRVKAIPDPAIEGELWRLAHHSIETYNPNKGAQLGSWVKTNLQKVSRFVTTYQNAGRIVEDRVPLINRYKTALSELEDKGNKMPTDLQILEQLQSDPDEKANWTLPLLQRLKSEMRADIMSSAFESDVVEWSPELDDDLMYYLEDELTDDELKVYKHIRDPNSPTKGKTGLIARALGMTDSKVSRLRKKAARKAEEIRKALE